MLVVLLNRMEKKSICMKVQIITLVLLCLLQKQKEAHNRISIAGDNSDILTTHYLSVNCTAVDINNPFRDRAN